MMGGYGVLSTVDHAFICGRAVEVFGEEKGRALLALVEKYVGTPDLYKWIVTGNT